MSYSKHPTALVDDEEGLVGGIDWLGNEFRIGDEVMYCISAGRGQMMAIGKVVAVRALPISEWANPHERENEGYRYRSEIVGAKVEVQVLTERTSGAWNNKTRTRPAWVNEMNITAMREKRENDE